MSSSFSSTDQLAITKEILPDEISMVKMIESRYSEINQLVSEVKAKAPKLISQKLPLHMRRRAASHNINRLPSRARKLIRRKMAGKDLTTSEAKEKKRKKCKKHHNKKKFALSQALRETKPDRSPLHIWFAKRFKMITVNGLIVPDYNTTKNRRKLHRMSKEGCIHFYLPHLQCVQIKYRNHDSWTLVERLSGIVNGSPGEEILCPDRPPDRWMLTISDRNGQTYGPGHFILIPKMNLLLVWVHKSIFQSVSQLLIDIFADTSIEVADASRIFQFFKFFGIETLPLIKKALGKVIGSHMPPTFQSSGFVFSDIKYDHQAEPVIRSSDQMEVEDEPSIEKTVIMFNKISSTPLTDIVVPYHQTRSFWQRLIRNRSHLVGGLRDFKIIASDLHRLVYPDFGFPDSPMADEMDRKPWIDLVDHLTGSKDFFILRDPQLIRRLNDDDFSLDELATNERLKQAFIIVELFCMKRGVPGKGDIVCLPEISDLDSFIGQSRLDMRLQEKNYGPFETKKLKNLENFRDSSREVIGFVEFGHFSLEEGLGKGFAAISFPKILHLISNKRMNTVFALIRSNKSQCFRFVKVVIDNFVSL
ncbi:POP1 ribonuclease P/MRP subunit [Brevipalpus obovatus]|uniref:POP1 ribonuclease P/MRP subunit n=1 Tax=Brevipalpus obovatus TaxID=246614 RepID=UPI003D9F98BB